MATRRDRPTGSSLALAVGQEQAKTSCSRSLRNGSAASLGKGIEVPAARNTLCHLSDIPVRLGLKLRWDPEKEEFVNDLEANRRLKRAMRSPWHL